MNLPTPGGRRKILQQDPDTYGNSFVLLSTACSQTQAQPHTDRHRQRNTQDTYTYPHTCKYTLSQRILDVERLAQSHQRPPPSQERTCERRSCSNTHDVLTCTQQCSATKKSYSTTHNHTSHRAGLLAHRQEFAENNQSMPSDHLRLDPLVTSTGGQWSRVGRGGRGEGGNVYTAATCAIYCIPVTPLRLLPSARSGATTNLGPHSTGRTNTAHHASCMRHAGLYTSLAPFPCISAL